MQIEILSFFAISFLIAVTLGPSVIYVVSYSLRYGAKAGVIATLGVNLGSVVIILIAAFGFSTLLGIYPNAMTAMQIIGGLYIVYLAWCMWPRNTAAVSESTSSDNHVMEEQAYGTLFLNGLITSVLNPKDMLFYTAFIPNFIPSNASAESYQAYFLGLAFTFMLIGFITKCTFAIFSGYFKKKLHSNMAGTLNRISSLILLALGLFLVAESVLSLIR